MTSEVKLAADLLNDEELRKALWNSLAPRITAAYMEERIAKREFWRWGPTLTLCKLTLDNGYTSVGQSACVNEANYNQEIGERVAYDNAFKNLWPLFGFLLAEMNFVKEQANDA